MSSNSFLNAPELPVLILSFQWRSAVRISSVSAALGFNTDSGWLLRFPDGAQPVLLLSDRSFWLLSWMLLRVQLANDKHLLVIARYSIASAVSWRRLKVHFLHSQSMLLHRDIKAILNK